MSKIIVRNNLPRVLGIGACNVKGKSYPELRLIPGANEVDAEDWKKAKEADRILAGYIEREEIEEGETAEEGGALPTKPSEAIKRVKETLDVKRLRGWLDDEKRPSVRDAIDKQIREIDSRAKKADAGHGG